MNKNMGDVCVSVEAQYSSIFQGLFLLDSGFLIFICLIWQDAQWMPANHFNTFIFLITIRATDKYYAHLHGVLLWLRSDFQTMVPFQVLTAGMPFTINFHLFQALGWFLRLEEWHSMKNQALQLLTGVSESCGVIQKFWIFSLRLGCSKPYDPKAISMIVTDYHSNVKYPIINETLDIKPKNESQNGDLVWYLWTKNDTKDGTHTLYLPKKNYSRNLN